MGVLILLIKIVLFADFFSLSNITQRHNVYNIPYVCVYIYIYTVYISQHVCVLESLISNYL